MLSTRVIIRGARLAVLAVIAAGCASAAPHYWQKPGVTEADFKRDNSACIKQASSPSGEVDAAKFGNCLDNMGYYFADEKTGWHDGRK